MLNSTKTWQERLWYIFKSPLGYSSIDNKNNSMYDLERFISDLRKKDEEELIKMLPHYCLEHEVEVNITELIKDYYAK